MKLRVTPSTRVTLSGVPVPPEQIPPGANVRASFERPGAGEPTIALSVDAKPAEAR
jgi:hypothetical protein